MVELIPMSVAISGPLKEQWGYLFVDEFGSTEDYRTLSHELGHGKTVLQHTFKDEHLSQGSTNNLMDYPSGDYPNGTDLVRAQWDMVHNPAIFTPLQSDGDGAMLYNDIIAAIKHSNLIGQEYTSISGIWGAKGTLNYILGKSPEVATQIDFSISKSNVNILSNFYKKEIIAKTSNSKITFYENSITESTAIVTFILPTDKVEKFLIYLGIINVTISGTNIEVIDGNTIAFISDEPKMPLINVKYAGEIKPNAQFEVSYNLKCHVKYSYTPYNSHSGLEEYDDSKEFETIKSNTSDISLNFGNTFSGGDLIINWKYGELFGSKTVLVRGKNPILSNIKSYGETIGTNKYWFFWKVMAHESSNLQFMNIRTISPGVKGKYTIIDENKRYTAGTHKAEQVGMPLWGYPSGYGLKQLDYSGNPALNDPKYRWNWKENLKGGFDVMESKIDGKNCHPDVIYFLKKMNGKENLILKGEEFSIGDYVFALGNSSFYPSYDLKITTPSAKKSFLDAVFVKAYNGGCIIEDVKEISVTVIDPITEEEKQVTKNEITIKSSFIIDNSEKRPYLFLVLDPK